MRIRLTALVGLALLLSTSWGCATIVQGSTQKVRITSEPTGASVVVYDARDRVVAEDETPCQVAWIGARATSVAPSTRCRSGSPGTAPSIRG